MFIVLDLCLRPCSLIAVPHAEGVFLRRMQAVRALGRGGPTGAAIRARDFPRSATLCWGGEGFDTDNLARQSAGMRRAATLPHGSTYGWRRDDKWTNISGNM